MQKLLKSQGTWIGKWTFVLAATGSAVGLGNIWGFPYKAGTEGGAAFVLIYLLCIVVIGVPIMISEILIGRRSGNSPINAMKISAIDSGNSSMWQLVGWTGIFAGVLILSFYSVIAGICINYIFISAFPNELLSSSEQFGEVISSPSNLLFWHTIFMFLTMLIVSAGVKDGIGRMVRILMPMLGFLLIFMVIYAMINGAFIEALAFLFAPDFSNIGTDTFLSAMGQAFFSLSLGMGSIMAYGAYMPKEQDIVSTSFSVGSLDTLIAILAGLAIFPIIFVFNLEPGSGPGLVFVSLLSAFNQMDFGQIIGPLFFILLSIAALSSSISILEPGTAYLAEEGFLSRKKSALLISLICWTLGIGTALGFNIYADSNGENPFLNNIELISVQILQPFGGMMIAIFVGWFMNEALIKKEITNQYPVFYKLWRFFIKFIAPLSVAFIFISQLI
ncbi:MAG: sodium-dependent transporter [Gammaproteobacteria bacterium]|nr:sodium-dependent transporter [Gammaproteobacteria bacterium]